jgi:hypothetical protein
MEIANRLAGRLPRIPEVEHTFPRVMGNSPSLYRVFLASPGDVAAERNLAADVIEELNVTHGPLGNYRLELLRWETHATPGAGRPQQVINDLINQYDIFVGVMWKRFGSPSGVADSGTQEEFDIAFARWQEDNARALMFFFSQKKVPPAVSQEDLDQQSRVFQFKQSLTGKALTWSYKNPANFEAELRKTLSVRMNAIIQARQAAAAPPGAVLAPKSAPSDEDVAALKMLWPRLSDELKDAFSVAYNENRRAADPGIATRDLFAALLRNAGQEIQPFAEAIRGDALPRPTAGSVNAEPFIADERPWLSHCVATSIKRLARVTPANYTITCADIFADIAKNGTGESVRLLREHNIQPADIDRIIKERKIPIYQS